MPQFSQFFPAVVRRGLEAWLKDVCRKLLRE